MLINWAGRGFEPLSDPVPSLRLRQMHEISPNSVAVDTAGFLSNLAGKHIVPVAVIADDRLLGVVPRAAILSPLATPRRLTHA